MVADAQETLEVVHDVPDLDGAVVAAADKVSPLVAVSPNFQALDAFLVGVGHLSQCLAIASAAATATVMHGHFENGAVVQAGVQSVPFGADAENEAVKDDVLRQGVLPVPRRVQLMDLSDCLLVL